MQGDGNACSMYLSMCDRATRNTRQLAAGYTIYPIYYFVVPYRLKRKETPISQERREKEDVWKKTPLV